MGIKISLADKCAPSEDFVSHMIEDILIIAPLQNRIVDAVRQIFTLSETGQAIWNQLDSEKTLGQVAAELSEQFSYPLKEVERDVLGIVAELLHLGICVKLSSGQAGREESKNNINKRKVAENSVEKILNISVGEIETEGYITSDGELSLSIPWQLALLKNILARGLSLRTTVHGTSMYPFICDRDILTIAPLKQNLLDLGDIVAFTCPASDRLVIHRIIKKTASGWLLKGDNCPAADGVIEEEQIIGYVTRIERGLKVVRIGLGIEKKMIAFFNRGTGLVHFKKIWHLSRRIIRRKELGFSDDR